MADAAIMYPCRVARESRSETRGAREVNESVRKVNNRYRARRATRQPTNSESNSELQLVARQSSGLVVLYLVPLFLHAE